MATELPWDDDNTTTTRPPPALPACPVCWTTFRPVGRQRFCSDNCRKTAWARTRATRHPGPVEPVPPPGRRRETTVYACPSCSTRYYAQQWCPDCQRPCRRLGLGGACPHCDELVTVDQLVNATP